ncbi:MAG: glycosyltransferase family 4 protein [Patescibacteria group bacterium]
MKILIATGIYPPDIGGPAQIALGVEEAWKRQGHEVKALAFRFERKLPTGIRHLYYFFRVLFSLRGTDFVFSPDTFSAALPALCAAKLFGKKLIIRTGGDFLWEQYVERTGDLVLLRNFYNNTNYEQHTKVRKETRTNRLNFKEHIIFRLVRYLFHKADAVIFSTAWQRDIFEKPYRLYLKKCFIVENYYGPPTRSDLGAGERSDLSGRVKVFTGGVRDLKWKNIPRVQEAFERVQQKGVPVSLELQTGSRGKFLQDIQDSYAVILASLGDVSPNTILEAISFGKPFILTRETGLYERLKGIGIFVNPESVEDIAAKIEWLADEKNYEAQRRKIEAFTFTHSWEEIAGEIMNIATTVRPL